MAENDVFTKLPLDVVFQILAKLPTESLLQLRCVSKSFNHLISHPHFLKFHFSSAAAASHRHHLIYYGSNNKAYFSFHADKTFSLCTILESPFRSVHGCLRIVGSAKGIICLFDTNYFTFLGTVILWNPVIGKFKILPCPEELNCFRNSLSHMVVGFGFDHSTVNFKVVQILYDCGNEQKLVPKALVYGTKSGSWKTTRLVVPCFVHRYRSSSVFVNGVVHWLAYKRPAFTDEPNCIMGFDVVEEEFKSMELPQNLGSILQNLGSNLKAMRLCPLFDEKSLALVINYYGNVDESWDLWLVNDYGKAESWTMNRHVVLEQFFPLRFLDGGGILATFGDGKLVSVDIEKGKVSGLGCCGLLLSFYSGDYMPSLAMLDMGEQLPE